MLAVSRGPEAGNKGFRVRTLETPSRCLRNFRVSDTVELSENCIVLSEWQSYHNIARDIAHMGASQSLSHDGRDILDNIWNTYGIPALRHCGVASHGLCHDYLG